MALPHKNDEMRVSVEAIEKAYNDFLKEHNYNIPVQLNIEERHPYDNTPEAIANGPRVRASYQQSKGRINVYWAAATGDNEQILRDIQHELVGHYGIDTFAPLDKRLLLDAIIQSRNEPDLKTTWDAVERFYPTQDKYTQAEEVYAFIAEVPQAWITAQPRATDHDPERLLLDLSHKNTITGLELRRITESVDNGIIAGLRKTQNFRENDYSAFSKTSDALEPIRRIDFAGEGRNEVQDAVKLAVETDPEKFIERFKQLPQSLGGYFISADTFKETFEQYRESNETRNAFNSPVHNSAAVLASAQFRSVLQEKPTDGKNVVVLLTGIPGAGKTSSVLEKGRLPNNVHAIYEGQLATPEVAITRVQQVLDAGFKPFIIVVHTTPERALDNTLQRFDEVGRGASINAMTNIQAGLPAGLAAVREKFHGAIELQIFDRRNSRPSVKLEGWQHLPLLSSEGNHEHIKQRLNNHLESRRASISTDAYDQAAGRPPVIRRQIDFQRDRTGIAGQHESLIHGREATQGNRHDAGITPSVVTSPNL